MSCRGCIRSGDVAEARLLVTDHSINRCRLVALQKLACHQRNAERWRQIGEAFSIREDVLSRMITREQLQKVQRN